MNSLHLYKLVSIMIIDQSPELHHGANLREACRIVCKDIPEFHGSKGRAFNISFDDAR